MTKILLFKHAYNFVFVFVRNFKQFIFWELYLNIFMHSTMRWFNWYKKNNYYCYTKKLCNLQYAITYFVWAMYFFYINWFILL